MKILFIHQNYPGQFKFLAPALAKRGHDVQAMTMQAHTPSFVDGVKMIPYSPKRGTSPNIHPWVSDFETKIIRAEACFRAALNLKNNGYTPDVIIAHPGWGESLFLKDVWPQAKLGIYCEFFYAAQGTDVGFDPEFPSRDDGEACRIRLKNINNILHFETADAGISPTHWQASTFPEPFRSKIAVIHDGIDTEIIKPDLNVKVTLNGSLHLTKSDEILTFVNRNLEPYRGYHIFMRALPDILKARPNARILIVGGDAVSYGAKPEGDKSWKEIFIEEVFSQIQPDDWKRVHFLGHIPYKAFMSLLQLSTVHVYLTYPFVLSWSLLEAMSAGCAIIASDTQPLHEAITHEETGLLVDFFDAKKLAETVSSLLGNAEARKRYGQNARRFAQENYDVHQVCLPRQLAWVDNLMVM